MDLATLFVRFKADTSDVDKSVKQMESNTTKTGQNIAKTLAKAFSAAVVVAGIHKTIDAASDLNETVSKTEVIFGNASTAVEKNADTAAKSMGLSKRAYLDAASSLKGLLDNMGLAQDQSVEWSQKLTQLGSDLGSFFNKDPEEAVQAIGAALRGETEPIRAFNVQISQAAVVQEALRMGLITTASEMDNNAKAQATLSLIMAQTTTAQGDFARTADGAANSQRIMKAEMENAAASIGQSLLPVFTQLVQFVSRAAEVFASMPAPVQAAVVGMLGFVALAGPLSKVIDVVGSIREALVGLGASAGPIGLAIVAIGYLAAAMAIHDDTAKQVAARAKEVAANLDEETDSIVKQRLATGTATTATQAYADAQAALSGALTGNDDKGKRLAAALGALGFQAGDAAKLVQLLSSSSLILATQTEKTGDSAYDAALANRVLFEQLLATKGVSADVADVLFEAGTGAAAFGGEADITKAKVKDWTAENRALVAAIIEVGSQAGNTDVGQIATDYLNAEVASSKFRAELVAQAEAQAGASRSGDDAGKVYQAYVQILESLTPAQAAQLDLTDQQAQANQALATSFTDADSAAATWQVRQDQLAARQKANADATNALTTALDHVGDKAYTAADAANDLQKALDDLLGVGIDLEEANRGIEEGIDKVTASIKENGATLDIQTEKGRNNRSAIEDQVKAIEAKIKADVASGVAVTDATNAGLLYREQLIQTAEQSGISREAAEDYINTLGLTPENVTTAVELQHDEEMKTKLQGLLTQLGTIDAGAAAEIQALIDKGAFDEAQRRLDELAKQRQVIFVPKAGGTGVNENRNGKSASGRFVPGGTNFTTSTGERPGRAGDEVILPLGDPSRIRQLLSGNDVGSRIFDAVGVGGGTVGAPTLLPSSTSTSIAGGSVTGLHVDHLEVHDGLGAAEVAQAVMFRLMAVG